MMTNKILFVMLFILATTVSDAQSLSDHFVTTWQTANPGSSNSSSITTPAYLSVTYNYDVDWNNDGVFDEFNLTGPVSHDYGTPGTYTIRIQGVFPRIKFEFEGDQKKLLTVNQWGTGQWTSMERAFYGCVNINGPANDSPDLSNVTSLEGMFQQAESFNVDIGNWDVSNVTNTEKLFMDAHAFNQDISSWDMSSVTNPRFMFANAHAFSQPIGAWNMSNVTSTWGMFQNAFAFNEDLSAWDMSNVTYPKDMFWGASSFNQDIGGWDMSNATTTINMFQDAAAFNQNIGSWNMSNVTNMSGMLRNAIAFDQDLGSWDVSNIFSAALFLDGAELSTVNYDALLLGWSLQALNNNLAFSAGNSQYCSSEEAHQSIIDNFGWSFIDNGLDPNCVSECSVDINGDGWIDVTDFLQFNSAFGTSCSGCPEDVNGDGDVDINDFLSINSAYGESCP